MIRDQKTFGKSRYPFSLRADYQPPRIEDYPGYREFDRIQVMLPWSSRVASHHVEQIASAIRKVVDVAASHRPSRPAQISERMPAEASR